MTLLQKLSRFQIKSANHAAIFSMLFICMTVVFSTVVTNSLINSGRDLAELTRLAHEQANLWNKISQRATFLMKAGEKGTITIPLIRKVQNQLTDETSLSDQNKVQIHKILQRSSSLWWFLSHQKFTEKEFSVSPQMISWMKQIARAPPELIIVGFTSWDINKTVNLRNGSEITRIQNTVRSLEMLGTKAANIVGYIIICLNLATLIGIMLLWKLFLSPALNRLTEAKQIISQRADEVTRYNSLIADLSFQAAKLHQDIPKIMHLFVATLAEQLDLELVAISLRAQLTGENHFIIKSENPIPSQGSETIKTYLQKITNSNAIRKRHLSKFDEAAGLTLEISTILSSDKIMGAIAICQPLDAQNVDPAKFSFFHSTLNLLAMNIESHLRNDIEHALRSVFDAMDQGVYIFDQKEKLLLSNGKSITELNLDKQDNYFDFVQSLSQTVNLTETQIHKIVTKPLKIWRKDPIQPLDIELENGKIFQLEWRKLDAQEFSVVVTDVTSLRLAEKARDRHKNQVTAAFLTTSDAVCVLNEDLSIEFHNNAFERILPHAPNDEHLDKNWLQVLRLNTTKDSLKNLDDSQLKNWLLRAQDTEQNLETQLSSGQIVIWSRSRTPENRIVLFARDVTELRDLMEKTAHADRMQAIGLLTGGIAHDFNNTLMIIQGNLELINQRTNDNKVLVHTKPAIRSCINASAMTEKLLSYSRRQTLKPINISPQTLCEDLQSNFEINKTFRSTITFNKETEHSIFADPEYLDRALSNLIINAQDAMKETKGVISINIKDYHVQGDENLRDGHYIAISVSDQGGGFDNYALDHAFEPYFTTKTHEKSTGLGLAMVFGFAQQSGGSTTIENNEEGAVVTLYLPCGPSLSVPVVNIEKNTPAQSVDLKGKSILVVEDTEFGTDFITEVLKKYNATVRNAVTVSQALAEIKNAKKPFDFILTDIDLPDGQGFDVLEHFEDSPPPCLFITGFTRAKFQAEAMKYNGDILKKPFSIQALISAVEAALYPKTIDHDEAL